MSVGWRRTEWRGRSLALPTPALPVLGVASTPASMASPGVSTANGQKCAAVGLFTVPEKVMIEPSALPVESPLGSCFNVIVMLMLEPLLTAMVSPSP